MENCYINIKEIAQAKGLKSTRSIRMEINKPESKYISREVKVNGGISMRNKINGNCSVELQTAYYYR